MTPPQGNPQTMERDVNGLVCHDQSPVACLVAQPRIVSWNKLCWAGDPSQSVLIRLTNAPPRGVRAEQPIPPAADNSIVRKLIIDGGNYVACAFAPNGVVRELLDCIDSACREPRAQQCSHSHHGDVSPIPMQTAVVVLCMGYAAV